MVIDGDAMSVEERLSPGTQPVGDFSGLHGFQFVGAREESFARDGSDSEQRRAALALELDARAARFHQAVDSSIVLASDGTIRWLGDSVAKLATGDDLLTPRTILLVDEAMAAEAQAMVSARLELWLKATTQRLLGPLFSLRAMQEGSPQLQDLAAKIANALGVLEREPVRAVVRGLDQDARAILRRQGVRFGSYYLYVPSTLRPASRALALQLWCVHKGDEEFSVAAQGLIPMASSGRTSAPPDVRVSAETYRVSGFRSCGERVVRVDIVERLADMIRAASTLRIANGSNSGPTVFQVTSQMTSLTGCSGEGFLSILRALGFESLTVERSNIIWPAAAAPIAPLPGADGAASQESQGAGAVGDESTASAPLLAPAGALSETVSPGGEELQPVDAPACEPTEPSSDAEARVVETPAEVDDAVEAAVDAPREGPPASVEDEVHDDLVTVWRFAKAAIPSRPRPPRPTRRRSPASVAEQLVQPRPVVAGPEGATPHSEQRAGGRVVKEVRSTPSEKPSHGGGRKSWNPRKNQRLPEETREDRMAPAGHSGGERKLAVDPASPFAKLMELRSILVSESKKRS
jgi:ATP-dependent RNA helicase SUPV3L1/SUV3